VSQKIFSNWPDLRLRDRALQMTLGYVGIDCLVQSLAQRELQHGRLLEVAFSSGRVLTLRFDQGVGYWRVPIPKTG